MKTTMTRGVPRTPIKASRANLGGPPKAAISRRAACAFALALLAGCAAGPRDVANRYYAPERFTPKPISQVQLLFARPTVEFEVIADFQARGETAEGMRQRGAEIGADAVIVTYLGGGQDAGAEWAGQGEYRTNDRIVGTAIKYRVKEEQK